MTITKAGLLRKNNVTVGAVLALLLGLLALPALGQEELTIQQQYDAAFLKMYQDIGNLDKTFHFAELAIAVGDLEGAIAALERMLIIDPDLPQDALQHQPSVPVKLEGDKLARSLRSASTACRRS